MQSVGKALVGCFIAFLHIQTTLFAQQEARTIPCAFSPDGIIGFLEFKPADYGTQRHPLIIFLHGTGERGNGSAGEVRAVAANGIPHYCATGAQMRFSYKGKASSFVVLSPQLSRQFGNWPPFYVEQMIKYAKGNLLIDTNRIYVTGLSLGGGGVWAAITSSTALTNSIAAAAPVCGTQDMVDTNFCNIIGRAHLPIWAFHAMDDNVVPVALTQHGEVLASICKLKPAAKFTYYKTGGHGGAWLNAYNTGHITSKLANGTLYTAKPNLYEWFLSNSKANQNTIPIAVASKSNE
ncbi:MAG: hypothetical protein QM726_14065 [Chitinophagaceae bacterium]